MLPPNSDGRNEWEMIMDHTNLIKETAAVKRAAQIQIDFHTQEGQPKRCSCWLCAWAKSSLLMADELERLTAVDGEKERLAALTFAEVQRQAHEIAKAHGFWEEGIANRNVPEMIALMHSELSEMLEAYRHKNPPSEHIPEFSGMEEEAADLIIRLCDTCEAMGLRLTGAIVAKMEFNRNRPYKHGGKLC